LGTSFFGLPGFGVERGASSDGFRLWAFLSAACATPDLPFGMPMIMWWIPLGHQSFARLLYAVRVGRTEKSLGKINQKRV